MRKVIADNMVRSLQIAAQMSSAGEADATELIKFRQSLLEQEQVIGVRISYIDIFVMAAAKGLKQNPIANSSIIGDEVKLWDDINIGVAVAIESEGMPGIVVPVVHNADKKSLVEIHNALSNLMQKVRERRLLPDDTAGSTFTITNVGTLGEGEFGEAGASGFSTPILRLPEVAMLGLGDIEDRVMVRGGELVIRPMLSYSFTTDHRLIDGIPAGRFSGGVMQYIRNPRLLPIY
jgi:pyruvate dehydrogenase E2 component (dihydrolipoamide acetyltransferase)/2-oxoglutarate dehydrogenase E2 component (dihydrolipoamide succinyltransferase)